MVARRRDHEHDLDHDRHGGRDRAGSTGHDAGQGPTGRRDAVPTGDAPIGGTRDGGASDGGGTRDRGTGAGDTRDGDAGPAVAGLQERWESCGAAALTGDHDGPALVAPAGLVERIMALGVAVGPDVDALGLVGERAAIAGLSRRGRVSCGGATRLLPAADGWVAVSLARPEDVDLVPAWFERDLPPSPAGSAAEPTWQVVTDEVATRPVADVVARARLLGLPVAALGEAAAARRPPAPSGAGAAAPAWWSDEPGPGPLPRPRLSAAAAGGAPGPTGDRPDGHGGPRVRPVARPGVLRRRPADGAPLGPGVAPLVVDFSSLWAGPLCARLLGAAGARVVKVESTGRPDGARRGPTAFYDLLHAGHRSVAVDFATPSGRALLKDLVAAADVVVEASRPRALARLGLVAEDAVRDGVRAWVSITARGWDVDAVGFGDDAAVAGGLVARGDDGRPRFVADAVADPLTGVAAAGAVLAALREGGRWLLDVSMAHVAAEVAAGAPPGVPWAAASPGGALPPRAPVAPVLRGRAAPLGADTRSVLAELACRPGR